MAIYVYNRNIETHCGDNNYRIYRPFLLSNPFTHLKDRQTKARYIVSNREEAVDMYNRYFDLMYESNIDFKDVVDEMYEKYRNGEDIYLECYCKKYLSSDTKPHDDEISCHGDIIKAKLEQRLIQEKIREIKTNKINGNYKTT